MSISVSSSGSLSPKDQFNADKRNLFGGGAISLGGGTGSTNSAYGLYQFVNCPPTLAGYASVCLNSFLTNRGGHKFNGINWTKGVTLGFRAIRLVGSLVDANCEFKVFLGKSYNTSTPDNRNEPTSVDNVVGFKSVGGGALQFMCSNGTAVSTVTSTFTPVNQQAYDVRIDVSGGTAYLYVNDILVATNTTAPNSYAGTGETQLMALWITAENLTAITGSAYSAQVTNVYLTQNS